MTRTDAQMIAPRVLEFSFKCNIDPSLSDSEVQDGFKNLQFQIGHSFGTAEADGDKQPVGEMRVTLSKEKNEGRYVPYEFDIKIAAPFEMATRQTTAEAMSQAAFLQGWSQLYGFVRMTIESFTAHAPFGPFLLPGMSMTMTDVDALASAISGLRRELSRSVSPGKDEVLDWQRRLEAIARAVDLGKLGQYIGALQPEVEEIRNKLVRMNSQEE